MTGSVPRSRVLIVRSGAWRRATSAASASSCLAAFREPISQRDV